MMVPVVANEAEEVADVGVIFVAVDINLDEMGVFVSSEGDAVLLASSSIPPSSCSSSQVDKLPWVDARSYLIVVDPVVARVL
jgi:hypothetical protein